MLYPSTLAQVEGANNPQPGEAPGLRPITEVGAWDRTDAVPSRRAKLDRDSAGGGGFRSCGGFLWTSKATMIRPAIRIEMPETSYAIRTDNGVPFASPNVLFGLSRLSIWWLRLGISIERIKPDHPEQNGRHERMHLTLKKEATEPASFNFLQQQSRFDQFVTVYHQERPHQALGMKYPAEVYTPSARQYRPPEEP